MLEFQSPSIFLVCLRQLVFWHPARNAATVSTYSVDLSDSRALYREHAALQAVKLMLGDTWGKAWFKPDSSHGSRFYWVQLTGLRVVLNS